jgi:hypothetical protein
MKRGSVFTLGIPHKNAAFIRAFCAIITHFFLSSWASNVSRCSFATSVILLGLLALASAVIYRKFPGVSDHIVIFEVK